MDGNQKHHSPAKELKPKHINPPRRLQIQSYEGIETNQTLHNDAISPNNKQFLLAKNFFTINPQQLYS